MSNIKLHLGDCLEILPELPKIDLVIADPPYGYDLNFGEKGRNYPGGRNYDRIPGDEKTFNFDPWIDFYPEEQFWFGAENFENLPKKNNSWLCWDKYPTDKNDKRLSGQFELIWSKKKHKRVILRVKAVNTSWVTVKEKLDHPTQKPVKLIEVLLEKFSKEGDVVFDPYMGTGTTGEACVKMNRGFIGAEIKTYYFEMAKSRIEKAEKVMRLPI